MNALTHNIQGRETHTHCRFYALMVVLALLLVSCAPKEPQKPGISPPAQQEREAAEEAARFDTSVLPATWKGTLPCADCGGIRYHLNIRPNHSFTLKRTYLASDSTGTDRDIVDSGTWDLSADAKILTLRFNGNILRKFKAVSDRCLRMLDNTGVAIKSNMNYRICRIDRFEPVSASTEMRGLYSYMADLGMFKDCRTGRRYPVAMEKDNAALERAYLTAEHGVAEPLIVRFEGYVTTRPAMEGSKMDKVVVVERFIEITSTKSCTEPEKTALTAAAGGVEAAARLENTRWELIEIAGEPVEALPGKPLPGFRLNPQGNSLRGFGGCNRMMGSYNLNGDELNFGPIATTRRFCEETQGLEDRFVQALGQVKTFKLNGDILELYGDYGLLARLRAADNGSRGI